LRIPRPTSNPATRTVGGPFALYLVVSFLYFGVPLLPHPGRAYVGHGADPQIFIWMFAWWPHALLHGLDPFKTTEIWAPAAYNLAWTTSVPALAVIFAPVTLLAGPVASYNLATILLPALAASTAYLLCRYLTHALWPSLVGGYLFGFSAYMLGQQEGHLHMTSVFLVPLVPLVVLRYLDGTLGGRRLAVRLGLVLGLQLWISTEVFFTVTLALAVGLLLGFLVMPTRRRRLLELIPALAGSYAVAAAFASPLIVVTLQEFHSGSINRPSDFGADLLSPVVPTPLMLVGGSWAHSVTGRFIGNNAENGAYLGLPALLMIAIFAVGRWRTASARFLLAAFGLAVFASLGTRLHLDGRAIVSLPIGLLAHQPLFDNLLPVRLALYSSLAAAVIVALWAATTRLRWLAVGLPVLAVVALLPRLGAGYWKTTPIRPAFFTSGLYKQCLTRDETVLPFPFGPNGDSMLLQAETGFWYRLAGGYVSPLNPSLYENDTAFLGLWYQVIPPSPQEMLSFARSVGVSTILVQKADDPGWIGFFSRALKPEPHEGIVAFGLGSTDTILPGCPVPIPRHS